MCCRREEHTVTDRPNAVLMPTDVSSRVGGFDRFAGFAAHLASRAPFFAFCLLLVVLWLAQGLVLVVTRGSISPFLHSEYQLEINTTTTIVTFLMVALLQNSQTRNDQATQHKLNAIADALADLMEQTAEGEPDSKLVSDMKELRAAIGLEEREGTSDEKSGP
jgi:low affinity Fe/Cu permease